MVGNTLRTLGTHTVAPPPTKQQPDDAEQSKLDKQGNQTVMATDQTQIAPKTSKGNAPVTRTADDGTKDDQLAKAASLVRRLPAMSNADVARRYGLSSDDVQQMRNQ